MLCWFLLYNEVIQACMCICILFQILSHYVLLQDVEYSSLYYTGRFLKWSFYKLKKKIIETKPQTDWLNHRLNLAEDRIRNYPECSTEREGDAKYEGEIK